MGKTIEGRKEGFQIDFFVFDAEFVPDVVAVKIDGAFRQMHHFRDGLGAVALANQVGDLHFGMREPRKRLDKFLEKGDTISVRFDSRTAM